MLKHVESSTIVYFSHDYSIFKMIAGNRQLDGLKIKRIIEEINNGNNRLRYYPILVYQRNDRLEILDGQHRWYICKQIKSPVFYILATEEIAMYEIARINSNVGKWKQEDFMNCYTTQENKHYLQLQSFLDTYGFNLGITLKLLSFGHPGKESGADGIDLNEQFRKGYFEVNEWDKAVSLAENCKTFQRFSSWRSRAFVIAIYRIIEADKYPLKELLVDFMKRPEYLTQQANFKSYIYTLEQMANVGKHKRVIIT